MGLMQVLARLDAVVLPRLSRGARRISRFLRRGPRGPLTLIAVVLVLLVSAVLVEQSAAHQRPADLPDRSARVGVSDGDSIPDYLSASRQRLAGLVDAAPNQPVYALVSFKRYLTPEEVTALVRTSVATTDDDTSGQLTTVFAKARVQIQNRQTEIVTLSANRMPDDLVATMAEVAARKEAEAARYAVQASADPAGPDAVSAALSLAEARAYRNQCACIYALVVRGVPATLARLAQQSETRVVDPAPQVVDPAVTAFVPPLPEQSDWVTPPEDGPTPSRSQS
jgi:hypothetical protein